jgi:GTP-binding protein HflX
MEPATFLGHHDTAAPGPQDRAVLVGIEIKQDPSAWTVQDSLRELGQLARTAGMVVAARTWQKLAHPDPATYVGSGKVQELKELATAEDARYVVFDDELAPGQQKKLEKSLGTGVRIIDRTRLILDIFSQHARSREGQLQVELAQYQYILPRLTGMRVDLEQQVGGAGAGPVGLRGPGETQLELDRRQIRRRITALRRQLEEVRTQRLQHRRQRDRTGIPVIALVGYTNAGKSSLLNALTGAGVLVQDKLFATLDPTTRRLILPSGREALLTDTVGFIRKLPHDLVAAFRGTLEGIEEASLIVHVVDASHPRPAEQVAAVDAVLEDLAVHATPRLIAWNKIDLVPVGMPPAVLGPSHPPAVAVSARTGGNLAAFLETVERMLAESLQAVEVVIPYDRWDLVTRVYEKGTVHAREETPEGVRLRASVPRELGEKLDCLSRGGRPDEGV